MVHPDQPREWILKKYNDGSRRLYLPRYIERRAGNKAAL